MTTSVFTGKEVSRLMRTASGLLTYDNPKQAHPNLEQLCSDLSRAAFYLETVDLVDREKKTGKRVLTRDPVYREELEAAGVEPDEPVTIWKAVYAAQLEEATRAGWRLPNADVGPVVGKDVLFLVFKTASSVSEGDGDGGANAYT